MGHADRACYDLKVHAEKSGVELAAYENFDKPVRICFLIAGYCKAGVVCSCLVMFSYCQQTDSHLKFEPVNLCSARWSSVV